MSEQDLNNQEEPNYEIPENDISENLNNSGLVGKSSVKEVIDAASGIDPTRFWIVFMVVLIIALASTIMFGGGYLIKQGDIKDNTIVELRKELKECPQKTLNDLKQQQRDIEELRNSVIYNSNRIQEIKQDKIEDVTDEKNMKNKLENINKIR